MNLTNLLAIISQLPALVKGLRAAGVDLAIIARLLRLVADLIETIDTKNP